MNASVSLEVELKSPIERVWHALTDPATLSQWMLFEAKDFRPVVGHKFQFRRETSPEWSIVVDCEVLDVDAPHRLAYTWVVEAQGHSSTVTWTLTESEGGTRLHMVQSGFRSEAKQEIGGAEASWSHMLQQLEALLAS